MEQKAIYDLHAEAKEWKNKLDFYRDDLSVMEKRISEVASKNTSKDVQAFVEHFQNQVILQKEQLDLMEKEVRKFSHSLDEEVTKNPVAVDHRKVSDNQSLRDKVDTFEKIFNDLRQELIRFLAKWM
jgi:hypothetical protein